MPNCISNILSKLVYGCRTGLFLKFTAGNFRMLKYLKVIAFCFIGRQHSLKCDSSAWIGTRMSKLEKVLPSAATKVVLTNKNLEGTLREKYNIQYPFMSRVNAIPSYRCMVNNIYGIPLYHSFIRLFIHFYNLFIPNAWLWVANNK